MLHTTATLRWPENVAQTNIRKAFFSLVKHILPFIFFFLFQHLIAFYVRSLNFFPIYILHIFTFSHFWQLNITSAKKICNNSNGHDSFQLQTVRKKKKTFEANLVDNNFCQRRSIHKIEFMMGYKMLMWAIWKFAEHFKIS